MFEENFAIIFDGEEKPELYRDLAALEVELDDELASMLRLRLSLLQQADGAWSHLDDDHLKVWKPIEVVAGFGGETEPIFSGYITHAKPVFNSDPAQCFLEVWAIDGSVIMDREDKLKAWPNKKDSDIAMEIFSSHGFTPEVEDTEVVHEEAVSTVLQRESDMRFLKRLALRNGYECFVEGDVGFFRAPKVDEDPQPILAAHFGEETNVNRISLEVNALLPAQVGMSQVDRSNKEVLTRVASASGLRALGAMNASGTLGAGIPPGKVFVGGNAATGGREMEILCQGAFRRGDWFVCGEAEVSGNRYGHVLKPRTLVTIKGIGEALSGIHYISHVLHGFNGDGYVQVLRFKRNGLMPTGEEEFQAGLGLPGLP